MGAEKVKISHRTWRRDDFLISTDPALVPASELNAVFGSDMVYWANPLPDDVMCETLENSLCFGLYEIVQNDNQAELDPSSSSIRRLTGFARCITDFTTFVFLTDVYVDSANQGKGLGVWLINCVQEVIESMPHLRRSLLFTSDWARSVPFYEKLMKMQVVECKKGTDGKSGEGPAVMHMPGPAFPHSLRSKSVDDA